MNILGIGSKTDDQNQQEFIAYSRKQLAELSAWLDTSPRLALLHRIQGPLKAVLDIIRLSKQR